jgi:hypothetical protein
MKPGVPLRLYECSGEKNNPKATLGTNGLVQCFSNGGPRTPGGPQGWTKGSARLVNCFCFLPMKKHVKWNVWGTKEKYDIVYFKYFTKYVYLSRIHIINSGTWLYFCLSLHVARLFTNGNFGIPGASEIFALDLCLMQTSIYMLEG